MYLYVYRRGEIFQYTILPAVLRHKFSFNFPYKFKRMKTALINELKRIEQILPSMPHEIYDYSTLMLLL